jgi:Na+/proline symporter
VLLIFGLIIFIYTLLSPPEIIKVPNTEGATTIAVIEYNQGLAILTYTAIIMFLCGVIALVYVAIRRFRQGLHGEENG